MEERVMQYKGNNLIRQHQEPVTWNLYFYVFLKWYFSNNFIRIQVTWEQIAFLDAVHTIAG